ACDLVLDPNPDPSDEAAGIESLIVRVNRDGTLDHNYGENGKVIIERELTQRFVVHADGTVLDIAGYERSVPFEGQTGTQTYHVVSGDGKTQSMPTGLLAENYPPPRAVLLAGGADGRDDLLFNREF